MRRGVEGTFGAGEARRIYHSSRKSGDSSGTLIISTNWVCMGRTTLTAWYFFPSFSNFSNLSRSSRIRIL